MKKVSELEGVELDYLVAKAEGATPKIEEWSNGPVCIAKIRSFERVPFRPSSIWSDGGPIVEREGMKISCYHRIESDPGEEKLRARRIWWSRIVTPDDEHFEEQGDTPLIAAMRTFVAYKFGDEVES